MTPPVWALYDVVLPGGVVVAGAVGGALHAAVAGIEVAAEAEREAVGRVVAEKLGGGHRAQGLLHRQARRQGHQAAAHPTDIENEH